jgi:hypothetical protein
MTNEPKNCLGHRFTHSHIYIYLYKRERESGGIED